MNSFDHRDATALRLPDFIHVGPPRTGTTWLHQVLTGHVGLPADKETLFFEVNYNRGIKWYADLFRDFPLSMRLGELGPTYFSNTVARDRIREHRPDCKIICTFREPAARLYSMYRLLRAQGRPVEDSFDAYWRVLVACGLDFCGYATHLRRWQEAFGEDRVLILLYEDLSADPQGYLDRVCDFIGIPLVALASSTVGKSKVYSAGEVATKSSSTVKRTADAIYWLRRHGAARWMRLGSNTRVSRLIRRVFVEEFELLSPASAEEVRHMMLPETEALEQMTGRDLSSWKPAARQAPHERESLSQTVRSI
jgi:hypothetical protein